MIDHKELMRQGADLIAANLAECCREELEWQNTALLCNGKMREAGGIYAQVDASYALSIVQSEVARQAMQVVAAAPQVVADSTIAGALFDLMGFLTTSETRYKFSAYDEASPAVEALQAFAKKRGLNLSEADVSGWGSNCAAAPVQAQEPVACKTCGGAGIVSDGEIDHYPDGTPYMHGPVECVKECPDCAKPTAPVQPVAVPDEVYKALVLASDAMANAWSWIKDTDVAEDFNKAGIAIDAILVAPAAQGDAVTETFDTWWAREQACPEHNLITENAARAAWAAAIAAKAAS